MLLIVQIHSHIIVLFSSSCADSLLTEWEHWVATHYRTGEVTCSSLTAYRLANSHQACRSSWYNQWTSNQEQRPLLYQFSSRKAAQTVASSVLHIHTMLVSHLLHCFESQKLTAFLQLSAPARRGKTSIGIIYCTCGMPECLDLHMVQCELHVRVMVSF